MTSLFFTILLVVALYHTSFAFESSQTPLHLSSPFTHCPTSLLSPPWVAQQQDQSLDSLLQNVSPPGTKRGFIAASPCKVHPDYFYTWTRDSSLVTLVLATLQQDNSSSIDLKPILYDYVDFQVDIQHLTADTPCQCLGEPKFNADGSVFTKDWGRPQNDGPAERALVMIKFATLLADDEYITKTLKPAIYLDLDYVVETWTSPCFDLWEEINGIHFYTLMAMRRGLLDGSAFSLQQGDRDHAHRYRRTARTIERRLHTFWSSSDNYIKVTQDQVQGLSKPSGLDISVLIAANLAASLDDGFFTPGSAKILATAKALEDAFAQLYPLNHDTSQHGIAMGRYPEDIYDGYGHSRGNPWFLATAAMTELYYHALLEWERQGAVEVTAINYDFIHHLDATTTLGHVYTVGQPGFLRLRHALIQHADRFLLTVHAHQTDEGALSEQFNRRTGFQQGALHLTWSYASYIAALHLKSLVC